MTNEPEDADEMNDIHTLVSDAALADRVVTEVIRELAVRRFRSWCEQNQVLKWAVEDPSNYFSFRITELLSETSVPLEEFKEKLEKFESRIQTMDAEQIFELLSDLNKKSILEIIIKYGLR